MAGSKEEEKSGREIVISYEAHEQHVIFMVIYHVVSQSLSSLHVI